MRTLLSTLASAFILLFVLNNQTLAQTSSLFDFNTPGELAENFNQTSNSTNISQSSNTGIGGTGAINVTSGSTNDVFTTKEGYSLGVTGSEYVFESYIKSVWNSGYSGLGFTNNSLAVASGSFPYRPNIGLGISVHGGGYVFHNNGSNFFGNWSSGAPAGVTAVKHATISDLLNNGSPDDWYRVVFTINRVSPTTYDMRVEIWPAMADGTLINPNEADAIMEMNGIENADITGSDILYSYFSFSGSRVSDFDNYSINLAGGATVVEAGAPVVFTNSSSIDNNVITVNGNAGNDNGSAITDRGIVYATTTEPDLNDTVIQSGSGTGEFTASTPSLGSGTYYVRTYAVNEVGTSYGSEVTYTVEVPETLGCTDESACNFVAEATDEDGSCTYPDEDYLDCEGNCLNDADNDGVCDELEVPGCTDESACNFVAEATDDNGSCFYAETGFDCQGNCLSEGISNATIVNTFWLAQLVDCETGEAVAGQDAVIIDFLPSGFYEAIYPNGEGIEYGEWSTNGCSVTLDEDFVFTVEGDVLVGWVVDCITMTPLISGCTDPLACNFNAEAEYDDDSCYYTVDTYYDCDGNCLNDQDGDGVCDELEIAGCKDPEACNFVAEATDDDNSCEYAQAFYDCDGNCLNDADEDGVCDEIEGCTDEEACNFNPEATDDDGSCFEPVEGSISGANQVLAFETETYTYPSSGEYEIVWTVENGTIVSGQGTSVIQVTWDEAFNGFVRAYEVLGDCEGPEDELHVTIFGVVGVDEHSDIQLNIYPNPSNGMITIDAGQYLSNTAIVEVLDATGRVVYTAQIAESVRADLSHLSSGQYIVRLLTQDQVVIEKLQIKK